MTPASPPVLPSWLRLRTRASYIALALGTIALGLGVHWRGGALGSTRRDVLGDALWAVMVAWWVGAVAPTASLRLRTAAALAVCLGVEVSQLYHTPVLDAVRSTTAGDWIPGSGFDPRDLMAYTLGVLAAAVLERGLARQ
jgi:hypothetical protein